MKKNKKNFIIDIYSKESDDMKNRKGFTLIEIIGVIIIIGVLALIAIPSFMSSLGVFRDDYYDNIVNTLENSGKEFFTDNKIYRPSKIFEARYVNLSTLEIENYIDNVEDYEGNSCNNDSYVIVVRRGKNDYEYAVCLKCEADDFSTMDNKYCDSAWLDSTKIGYGLGEIPTLYVYKGTRREELKEQLKISAWIIKYDNDGNEIDRVDGSGLEEVPDIYPVNLDTIDTSKAGEYKTTYVFNEKSGEGKVVVYENSAPSITIKKENIVKSGTALENKSETKVSNYISGEWAQKITITMRAEDVNYNNSKTNVTKFQWKIDDRWLDFCDATDGRTCTKVLTNEMNEEHVQFRAVDDEGNISLVTGEMTIRIDNTKPTCELSKSGQIGDNDWYVGDVTLTFNSSKTKDVVKDVPEAVSGITKRIVTLSEITGRATEVHTQDTSSVTWYGYVEDKAQNYTICSVNFKKDATAPVCELNLDGTMGDNNWYISDVDISFSKNNDTMSGVSTYGLDSYTGDKTAIQTLDTKEKTYIGYIKDNAGNTSNCTISFKKDATKPECGLKLDGNIGDNNWYISDVTVSFNKNTDAMSGVSTYGLNSATGIKTDTQKTDISSKIYTGYIKDNAGNENTCTSASFKRDATKPTCTNSGDSTKWTNLDREITYGCSDNLSGCKPSESGGSQTFNTTKKTASISSYKIKDNAGNTTTCAERTANVYVDKTAPECTNRGDSTTWTNGNRTIYYECSDSDSGCSSGGSKTFSSTTTTATIASYTITDAAGNSKVCPARTANVYVDKDSPTCTFQLVGVIGDDGWYRSSTVIVSSSFNDNGSGVSNKGIGTASTDYNGVESFPVRDNTKGTTFKCFVKDAAGNTGQNSITLKKDDGSTSGCIATTDSAWTSSGPKKVTVKFTSPPVSGCKSWSSADGKLGDDCTYEYYEDISIGNVAEKIDTGIKATTKSGIDVSCYTTVDLNIDKEKPTIKCEKSNTGTESGVTVTCECGDGSGSGVKSCAGQSGTKAILTNVKGSAEYTVIDIAGNSEEDDVPVDAVDQTMKRTKTWNSCKTKEKGECTYSFSYSSKTATQCPSTNPYFTCNASNVGKSDVVACAGSDMTGSSSNDVVVTTATCKEESCEEVCKGGWNDFGDWSSWSEESCTANTLKECKYRTIYN